MGVCGNPKTGEQGIISPAVLLLFLFPGSGVLHVVEDPVPYDEETGDDHVGEESCSQECCHDDDLVVHGRHLQASAVTPSAQVSITVRIESSSYEEIETCCLDKLTKYSSPLGSWHFRVTE